MSRSALYLFFFQAEDGIRDYKVTGVQTCALPIFVESVASRLLRDQRRGDQLGHVVSRLTAQVATVGELEEGQIAHGVGFAAATAAASRSRQATDAALDPPHAGVVRSRRQVDTAEPLPQVREIVDGRLGRLEGIAPLVDPRIDGEPVQPG